ncbi:MAG TPA: peptide deformylase [Clostridiales bacterium]|nr:peptide deformylase [Clostridiales bacterium]
MAIRDIVKDGDPLLRKHSRDVDKFDGKLHALLNDMLQTMRIADGVGIAAPQVGILRKAVICELEVEGSEEGEILEMINPVITAKSGEQVGMEGCLSVPGKHCEVLRPEEVSVEFQDRFGAKHSRTFVGFNAVVASHEIDHLSGILFYDKQVKEGK